VPHEEVADVSTEVVIAAGVSVEVVIAAEVAAGVATVHGNEFIQ
jgi:hypothetical protein